MSEALRNAASTELVRSDAGAPTIKQYVQKQAPEIERALAGRLPTDRFVRAVLTELSKNPTLQECTPASVMGALMTVAQYGLELGPLSHAYLVPFRDHGVMKCQLILGYKGMVELARRAGSRLVAREVYANDEFSFYSDEHGDHLRHIPAEGERGEIVKFYMRATFADGSDPVIHVMTPADVEKRRQRSRAKDNGPWQTDTLAMQLKTVVRAGTRFVPFSNETDAGRQFAQASAQDEAVISLTGEDLVASFPDAVIDVEATDESVSGDAATAVGDVRSTTGGAGAPPEVLESLGAALDGFGYPEGSTSRNKFVGEAIGRNVRGLTTLTNDEAGRVADALTAQALSDRVTPPDEATDDEPFIDEEKAHYLMDLMNRVESADARRRIKQDFARHFASSPAAVRLSDYQAAADWLAEECGKA